MILVDSNIPMYVAGAAHPNKAPSVAFLERVASGQVQACVSTEILQEILHRYRAIGRWDDGRRLYTLVRQILPVTLALEVSVLDRARGILDKYPHLMARDGVHAATCFEHSLEGICSYDTDYDAIKGLRRFRPDELVGPDRD